MKQVYFYSPFAGLIPVKLSRINQESNVLTVSGTVSKDKKPYKKGELIYAFLRDCVYKTGQTKLGTVSMQTLTVEQINEHIKAG